MKQIRIRAYFSHIEIVLVVSFTRKQTHKYAIKICSNQNTNLDTKKKCVLEINNSEYADRHSLKDEQKKNQYVEFDHVILC